MSKFDFLGSFLGKKAKLTKDGHDLSNLEAASFPFGVNVPVTYYPVVPNEHYRVKMSGMLQTAPMREDNFAQIYSNQKAVFVPISSFWRNYNETTQLQKATRHDVLFDYINYAPVFNLADVLLLVFPNFVISRLVQALISVVPNYYDFYYNSDSNDFLDKDGNNLGQVLLVQGRPDFAHQCASSCHSIFISQSSTISNGFALAEIVNNVQLNVTPAGTPVYMDTLRMLDALGYGNYYPAFESFFSYIVNGINPDVEIENYFFIQNGRFKLDGHFFTDFIHPDGPFTFANTLLLIKSVSALPLLAYQYYVSLVERSNYRHPDVSVLSYDSILNFIHAGNTVPFGEVQHNSFCFIFGFDYFTPDYDLNQNVSNYLAVVNDLNILQKSDLDFLYLDSPGLDEYQPDFMFIYLFSLNNPKLPSDIYTTMTDSVVQGNVPSTDLNDVQDNIVKAYANSSALYSLRQDLLRAGVRRDKQMQAIFGVSGSQHVFEPIKVLDDTSSQVQIQGLLNQAETSEAALGARAARGNGKYGLQFNFDSEEFGYIFIVQNFTCSVFYENFMIDRVHTLSPDAWFNPKFNHLGLEHIKASYVSVASGDVYNPALESTYDNPWNYTSNDHICGYSSRNYELKQRVNRVHGAFTNFPLPNMPVVGSDPLYASSDLTRGNAPFGGFVPTVLTQQTEFFDYRHSLYYSPNMLNNLFVNMVAGGLYGDYATDFFRCAYTLSVHKVSPMPKLGLFKLDV